MEKDLVGHRWWAEDVYVIGISNEHAPLTYQGLDKAKDGVESEGKELCSQGAALSCARLAADDLGGEVVTPNVELGGLPVV